MDESKSRFDIAKRIREAARGFAAREKYTEGVPLSRLIPYRLSNVAEIVLLRGPSSQAATRFRQLAADLAGLEGGGPRFLAVTSPETGDGKSFVSVNLALAMAAEAGDGVLLLNADFRGAGIDGWIQPAPKVGLAELLRDETDLRHVVLDLENASLKVLPAGTPPLEPATLLASDSTEKVLQDLRGRFHRIVIDTPPVEQCSDADVIGGWSDGFLLVTRAGQTRESSFLQALSSLSSAAVIGTVFNDDVQSSAE